MLHCTMREPNPWSTCRFEQEAQEDPPRCAYCDACEVASPGDHCSDQCFQLDLEESRASCAPTTLS